jgi:hypothetical protein
MIKINSTNLPRPPPPNQKNRKTAYPNQTHKTNSLNNQIDHTVSNFTDKKREI